MHVLYVAVSFKSSHIKKLNQIWDTRLQHAFKFVNNYYKIIN